MDKLRCNPNPVHQISSEAIMPSHCVWGNGDVGSWGFWFSSCPFCQTGVQFTIPFGVLHIQNEDIKKTE